ncbi:MAG: hypothetical protein LBJ98_03420 [Endomicrobium sp.]|nr:hypothetical protein [Endomicrobium sp.]
MKKMTLFLLVACFCLTGCASIYTNRYTSEIFPPTNKKEIHVYSISYPKKPYVEIAEILSDSSDSMEVDELKKEAATLGADGIIIIEPNYKTRTSYKQGSETTVEIIRHTSNAGKKLNAIAIKYTGKE